MNLATKAWIRGAANVAIGGGATAVANAFAPAMASAVGVPIPSLNPKQVIACTVVATIWGLANYLKQSPLPKDETDTQFLRDQSAGDDKKTS